MGFSGGSYGKESACNAGEFGSVPGLGRSPRGGHGKPLWYSCLENPSGFAWRALVYGVTKSQTTEHLSTDINFIIILTVFFHTFPFPHANFKKSFYHSIFLSTAFKSATLYNLILAL